MDLGPGQKAKLLNLIDGSRADASELEALYTIDVTVSMSPNGTKCGAITVFKANPVEFDYERLLSNSSMSPEETRKRLAEADELSREASTKTETMYMEPIFFKLAPPDNRWMPWALQKALELYDQFGGSAKIVLKCPRLKIRVARGPASIAAHRSDLQTLFPVVRDIDQLLEKQYRYDPWNKVIRRGPQGPTR